MVSPEYRPVEFQTAKIKAMIRIHRTTAAYLEFLSVGSAFFFFLLMTVSSLRVILLFEFLQEP